MDSLTYPLDLYNEVKTRWNKSIYEGEKVPNLPDEETFNRIVDVVYHASFLTEEKRRIWFRVTYASKELIAKEAKKRTRDETSERYKIISFDRPRVFSVEEIVKLAPAADPTQVLIGIFENDAKKLEIWGLIDAGTSYRKLLRHEASSAFPPPHSFTVSSKNPGQIIISRMGFIELILEQGRIVKSSSDVFYDGPVHEFLERGAKRTCKELCERVNRKCWNPSDPKNDLVKNTYIEFIEDVLERIRERFHGGTIVMVPDEMDVADTRLQDRIIIKYPCSYDASELLINELVEKKNCNDMKRRLWRKKEVSLRQYRGLELSDSSKQNAEEMLKNAASFISSLTAVDGAVVLTDNLRLLGFGAEITATSPRLNRVKVITDFKKNVGENKDIEFFGTRHRSAFRFCSSFEDSIAFIVSQDGEIKVAKRVGSEVVLWLNINVGSLGF